jgi:hypothetical protein
LAERGTGGRRRLMKSFSGVECEGRRAVEINSEGLLLEKTFRTTGSSREVDEKLEKLS